MTLRTPLFVFLALLLVAPVASARGAAPLDDDSSFSDPIDNLGSSDMRAGIDDSRHKAKQKPKGKKSSVKKKPSAKRKASRKKKASTKRKSPSSVLIEDVRFFWFAEHLDGLLDAYGLQIDLVGTGMEGGIVETMDGTRMDIVEGVAKSPRVDLATLDESFGSGKYRFALAGMEDDTLTFSLDAVLPEAPIGTVDIDSPRQGDTTGPEPLLEWSCNGCLGDRLELVVVDKVLGRDVFRGPKSDVPGVGDERSSNARLALLARGLHRFETFLLNVVETPVRRIHPEETADFDVALLEAFDNANFVTFTVPEPGGSHLTGAALMTLAGLCVRRRASGARS
jgi:hypothetical protein